MYKYDSIEKEKKRKAWINPRRSEMSETKLQFSSPSTKHIMLGRNSHEMKSLGQSQCFVECSLKEMQSISYS